MQKYSKPKKTFQEDKMLWSRESFPTDKKTNNISLKHLQGLSHDPPISLPKTPPDCIQG